MIFKKLKDKTIIVICSICMSLMCCFGISYKSAHKTYADTTMTTKQTLGMWLTSLLASMGARIYIASAEGYAWIADNFDAVMEQLGIVYNVTLLAQDMQEAYNNNTSVLNLPELPSKAISKYLENLWDNGFRSDSVDYDIGEYTENAIKYYISGTQVKQGITNWPSYYVWGSDGVRFCFTNRGNGNLAVYAVAESSGKRWNGSVTSNQPNINNGNLLSSTVNVNGHTYYYSNGQTGTDHGSILINYCNDTTSVLSAQQMVYYTFGVGSTTVEEIQVYGDGTIGLDDIVNTADRDKETEIDYGDLLGEEVGTKTLAEIMEMIKAILDGESDEAIPEAETIIKQPIMDPTVIKIPLLFDGLPEITEPECKNLNSCLVSGVQTASQHLQNVYNSNSNLANYTMVSLAIGIALYILTGGI